jgi:4-alpha-glucanotransferase
MSALHDLAAEAGLHVDWKDALGEPQRVGDDALVAILSALGYPADSEAAIRGSRDALAQDTGECAFVSADVSQPVLLPRECGDAGLAELILEDGTRQSVTVQASAEGLLLPAIRTAG